MNIFIINLAGQVEEVTDKNTNQTILSNKNKLSYNLTDNLDDKTAQTFKNEYFNKSQNPQFTEDNSFERNSSSYLNDTERMAELKEQIVNHLTQFGTDW